MPVRDCASCPSFSARLLPRGVEGLAGGAEGDELLDATRAGLGLLGVLHPPEDRVTIRAVERVEEGARSWVACERSGQVRRYLGGAGAIVCARPAAVGARTLH